MSNLASKLISPHLRRPIICRMFSPQAAKAAAATTAPGRKLEILPNGIAVGAAELTVPICRVAIAFKGGSRFEMPENLGITHTIRNCTGLSTKNATAFGITRNIQQLGATITTTSTREHIIYSMECIADELDTGMKYLAQVATQQVFKPWEVSDAMPRMKLELQQMKQCAQVILMEQLHRLVFRKGLGNPLYCSKHMLGQHTPEMMQNYVNQHFTTNRTAVVAVGVPGQQLMEYANDLVKVGGGAGPKHVASKYSAGEMRIDMAGSFAHVAVIAEGLGIENTKDALSAAVLQNIMGTGPSVKRGTSTGGKLAETVTKATKNPAAACCLNVNYTDSGLLGFYVVGQPKDMETLVKSCVEQFNTVLKSGITDEDVENAKNRVKAGGHMAIEGNTDLLEEMAIQASNKGSLLEDIQFDKLVDSITLADVQKVAKKIISGKPSMVAIGNLSHTPYLDQLSK